MRNVPIRISADSETPLYLQLADALRRAIREGAYPGGEKLPSIRRIADEAGVNPATAVSAYRILEREGWVEARAGSGVYARSGMRGRTEHADHDYGDPGRRPALSDLASGKVLVPPGVLDMAAGAPSPALFPVSRFKELLDEVLDRDGGWAFGYQESAGWPPFREAVAEYMRDAHGIDCEAADIRIVSGAQQGIDLAAKALLGPRDSVATESPTYRGALSVFWSRGAETIPVPIEGDGPAIDAMERIVRERKPRLAYVIPRYQNPTTVCWTETKMRGLLEMAERGDFYVLEDDLLSDLSYGPRPAPSSLKAMDSGDRVIYVRGFSKVLMPGLRLGAVVIPKALRERFEAAKRATDISTDGLTQRALDLYLRRGLHRDQLERLGKHYARVYEAAVAAARKLEPLGVRFVPPGGGLHLWLELPAGVSGTELRTACLGRSVSIVPEAVYGTDSERPADAHVRVSFAALDAEETARGLALIGQALSDLGKKSGERPLL